MRKNPFSLFTAGRSGGGGGSGRLQWFRNTRPGKMMRARKRMKSEDKRMDKAERHLMLLDETVQKGQWKAMDKEAAILRAKYPNRSDQNINSMAAKRGTDNFKRSFNKKKYDAIENRLLHKGRVAGRGLQKARKVGARHAFSLARDAGTIGMGAHVVESTLKRHRKSLKPSSMGKLRKYEAGR